MEQSKKIIYLILGIQTIILFSAYYFVRLDDAYIFYKYAINLIEHRSYAFNLDEKVNATTSTFYTLLLGLFYLPFKSGPEVVFPLIGTGISILSVVMSAILLSKIFERDLQKYSLVFPILLLSMPHIKSAIGMETFLKMFLIVLSIFLLERKRMKLLGIVFACLLFTRPDSIIFIIVLFILYFLKEKEVKLFQTFLVFILTVLPMIVFLYTQSGSIIPTSLQAKIFQSDSKIINGNYLSGFINLFSGGKLIGIFFYLTILVSSIVLIKDKSSLLNNFFFRAIFIYFLIEIMVYAFVLNPPPYPWYYSEFIIFYGLVLASAIKSIYIKLFAKQENLFYTVTILLIFFTGIFLPFKTIGDGFTEKYLLYKNVAEYLNKFSVRTSSLATDEVGILGFYYKGKIIDELGLIHSNFNYDLLKYDFSSTVKLNKPNFVIVDFPEYPSYKSYVNQKWFIENYSEFYTLKFLSLGVRVYKRISND